MDYKEYMNTLTEQIGNKRARQLVSSEIQGHIEDLADSYIEGGMEPDAAISEAVRQMGDPVKVGIELDKIHRPRFPYSFLSCALILITAGIITQSKIFPLLQNTNSNTGFIAKTIGYNIIGLCTAFGIIYGDYTILAKYASRLWLIFPIFAFLPFISKTGGAYPILNFLLCLFPIIFASFIYRQRNKGLKGIFFSFVIQLAVIWCLSRFSYFAGFTMETFLICFFILIAAILKGIFGNTSKIRYIIFAAGLYLCQGTSALFSLLPLKDYQRSRITALFSPETNPSYNYVLSELKDSVKSYSLWGNHELSMKPFNQLVSNYMINNIFSWFGIAAGALILGLLIFFCIKALKTSLSQSNRIGFLLGTGCSIALLVRTILYIAVNFGLLPAYSTYMPFLQYGLANAVLNSIYIGIIMCVYRNSSILCEQKVQERKPLYKTRIRKLEDSV